MGAWEVTYSLSIGAIPEAGEMEDTFRFVGILTVDGWPMPGIVVRLVHVTSVVGEDVTGANGEYEIRWTADVAGTRPFHAVAPGLYTVSPTITVQVEIPSEKYAEMDVYGIRMPLSTEKEIKDTIVDVCNRSLAEKGQPGLEAQNPRLHREVWAFWKCTVDVVGVPSGTPMGIQSYPSPIVLGAAFWLAVVIWLMGAIIGYLIGKWITYRVEVRPLEEALQEVVRDIDEVIDSKHEALEAGLIDADFAAELDEMLEEARDEAEEAGEDPHYDWVDYIGKLIELGKYIPWIVGGAVTVAAISAVSAYAPRRRG